MKTKILLVFFLFITTQYLLFSQCNCPPNISYTIGVEGGITYFSQTPIPKPFTGGIKSICIKGKLIIDTNWEILQGTFHMATGSQIQVNEGVKFRPRDCNFQSIVACNAMWKGILVRGVLEMPTCQIRNAIVGVDVSGSGNINELYGCRFLNCHTGIRSNPGSSLKPPRVLSNNTFLCINTLIFPYVGMRTQYGMLLDNANLIVTNSRFQNIDYGIFVKKSVLSLYGNNTFRDCNFGAFAVNHSILDAKNNAMDVTWSCFNLIESKATISFNVLDSISGGINSEKCIGKQLKFENNTMTNVYHGGILCANNSPSLSTEVNSNSMSLLQRPTNNSAMGLFGINFSNVNRSTDNGLINNNTINVLLSNTNYCEGIQCRNIDNLNFNSNQVNFTGVNSKQFIFGFNTENTSGIKSYDLHVAGTSVTKNTGVFSEMSSNNSYCCTHLTDLQTGLNFEGANNGTSLRSNTFRGTLDKFGLYYYQVMIGKTERYPGNDWNANFVSKAAKYDGNATGMYLSKLLMSTDQLPFYPQGLGKISAPVSDPKQWFQVLENGAPEFTCSQNPICPKSGGGETFSCDIVNSVLDGPNGAEVTWQARKYLLEAMNEAGNTAYGDYSDPCFQNFFQQNLNTSMGRLAKLSADMKKLYTPDLAFKTMFTSLNVSINSAQDIIANLLTQLEQTGADSISIYDQILVQQNNLEGLQNNYQVVWDQYVSSVNNKAALLAAQISNLSSSVLIEQNDIYVSKLILNSGLWGFESLNTADMNQLTSIAAQCPIAGGDAVFRARAILIQLNPELTWDDSACHGVVPNQNSRKQDENINALIAVYPNPASELLNLALANSLVGKQLSISMEDLTGKSIMALKPSITTNNMQIDIKNIPNGIYFIKISDEKAILHSQKINILR